MIKQLNYVWVINPNHPLYNETLNLPLQIAFRTNAGYEVYGRKMGYYRIKEDDCFPVVD